VEAKSFRTNLIIILTFILYIISGNFIQFLQLVVPVIISYFLASKSVRTECLQNEAKKLENIGEKIVDKKNYDVKDWLLRHNRRDMRQYEYLREHQSQRKT